MSEILLLSNPSKRHRRKHKAKRKTARRASRRVSRKRSRHVIRARRNPIGGGIVGGLMPAVKGGFVGAGGALLNDLAFGYGGKFLPASMQSGLAKSAVKVVSGVVIGALAGKLLRGRGAQLALGAVTVEMHSALKSQIGAMLPSLPLGEYMGNSDMESEDGIGYIDSAQPINGDSDFIGDSADNSVGEYM